ncbi:MAG: HAD family hydrolase [Bacillota bacterium]
MTLDHGLIRVIVYDLDGTVYDDTRHFELYAREIQSHLPESVRDQFWADYTAAAHGRHPSLRIGTFYDVARDLVLEIRGGRVARALHWDGSEIPPVVREQLYTGPLEPDHQTLLNVGDLWWVPSAVSYHYGGLPEKHGEAFLRIRKIMSDPDFEVRPIPDLAEVIGSLRGKVVQVLATNSPQPDSEAILKKVGLMGLFDRMYFRSNKPAGLKPMLEEIARDYQVEMRQILSVGDNLVNEITPVRALGCQTVFIDPHGVADPSEADLIVPAMSLFFPELERIAAGR